MNGSSIAHLDARLTREPSAADLVISDLATSEVVLRERVTDLESERDVYRELLQMALEGWQRELERVGRFQRTHAALFGLGESGFDARTDMAAPMEVS